LSCRGSLVFGHQKIQSRSEALSGQDYLKLLILAARLYENQIYISLDGHVYSWHAYLMNERFFNILKPEEQQVLLKGVEITKSIHREMTSAQDLKAATVLTEVGVEVTELSAEQIELFRQKTQPNVRPWVEEQIGKKWVEKIFKAIKAYGKSN
jgi:C4-dicarboxylate-binding protein DctP